MLSIRELTYTEIAIRIALAALREQDFEPSNLLLQPDSAESSDTAAFTITLKSRIPRSHEDIMCLLRMAGIISYVEEL